MTHGVAVRREGAGGRIDLLDAPVPEVAALVDHVIAAQLLDAQLNAERVALRRQPAALQRAEDGVRVRLEEREVVVRALRDGAVVVVAPSRGA